jgi:hypothetical protein
MYAMLMSIALAAPGLVGADHRGRFEGDAITWESTYVLSEVTSEPFTVPFSGALATDVVVTGATPAGHAVRDGGGAIVGFQFDPAPFSLRRTLAVRQSGETGDVWLDAPLAETPAVQRVLLAGATFEPDPAYELVSGPFGDRFPLEMRPKDRRAVDRLFDNKKFHILDRAIYLTTDGVVDDVAGLRGTVEPRGAVPSGVAPAVGGLFVATLGGLAFGLRALNQKAAIEAAGREA